MVRRHWYRNLSQIELEISLKHKHVAQEYTILLNKQKNAKRALSQNVKIELVPYGCRIHHFEQYTLRLVLPWRGFVSLANQRTGLKQYVS